MKKLELAGQTPDSLYHEVLSAPSAPIPGVEVVGRPGQPLQIRLSVDDVLLRVALGEPGLGYVAALADGEVTTRRLLAARGIAVEEGLAGGYAVVRDRVDRVLARRIVDEDGVVPPGQLLLRLRRAAGTGAPEGAEADDAESGAGLRPTMLPAGDALGRKIVDLLWEPIAETDVPRMADRLRRLELVLDAVSDFDAGALLARLEHHGDLYLDFEYRLSTPTRLRLRDKLRRRARQRPGTVLPPTVFVPPIITIPPVPDPDPGPPPTPTPQPQPQRRVWNLMPAWEWKQKKHWRVINTKLFDAFFHFEIEVNASVNATGSELATFKAKWDKGIKPGGEVELQFQEWFVPGVKLETDNGKLLLSVKKKFTTWNGNIEIDPHLQASQELVKTEFSIPTFKHKFEIFGQEVVLSLIPKGIVTIKIDIWEIIRDRVKQKLKDLARGLLEDLLGFLGEKLLGARAKAILAGLLGGVLARLWLADAPNDVISAPPDDIKGKNLALTLAGTSTSTVASLQKWADAHRHAFSKAYADTILQLTRGGWQDTLANLKKARSKTWENLPALSAGDAEWEKWEPDASKQRWDDVPLPSDDFVARFRWYELVLMVAVALWILRKISKRQLDEVKGVALEQASVAGMAAAVQYVQKHIHDETFEFIDEAGKTQQADGVGHWGAVAQAVQQSMSDDEVNERLEPMALEQLPHL